MATKILSSIPDAIRTLAGAKSTAVLYRETRKRLSLCGDLLKTSESSFSQVEGDTMSELIGIYQRSRLTHTQNS